MIRTNTQDQVLDFLKANPGSTMAQLGKELSKSRNVIKSAISALEAKNMCAKVAIVNRAWTYRATAETTKAVTRRETKVRDFHPVPPPRTEPVKQHVYTPYKAEPWEPARPGADAHHQYKSRGV